MKLYPESPFQAPIGTSPLIGGSWGSKDWHSPFGSVPSGSLILDAALGTCGFPRNHITELIGGEGSGKTTLAMEAVAALQALGGCALVLDLEHSWDDGRASALGISQESAFLVRPKDGEQAQAIASEAFRSGVVDLMVIDSLTAWLPWEERERSLPVDFGERQAESTRRGLLQLVSLARLKHAALLVTNQLRGKRSEGYSERTCGWPSLQLLNSIRIRVDATAPTGHGNRATGLEVAFKVVKNSLRSRLPEGTLELSFADGLLRPQQAVRLGLRRSVIERDRQELWFDGVSLGTSEREAVSLMRHQPLLLGRLETSLRTAAFETTLAAPG